MNFDWLVATSVSAEEIGLPNDVGTIGDGLSNVILLLMGLIGGLALIALIYGGVQFTLSAGDPGQTKQAKNTILYAVVGIVLAASAYMLVWFITHNIGDGFDFFSG
ncbi:hypothetical protein IPG36_01940 [bacterium]|nr:MAG: hypothetical protein IPG36_01940 [bacterium]